MKRIKISDDYYLNANSLQCKTKHRKESSGNYMGKRFYTALDMSIIKMDAATRNAQINRGELKRYGNEYIAVCGCGVEGCFVHHGFNNVSKEKMDEWEKNQAAKRNKKRTKEKPMWMWLKEMDENDKKMERLGFDPKTSFKN